MPTAPEPRIEDIPRIAFVTRRFDELKGLKTATFGAGLLVGCLLQQITTAGGRYRATPFEVLVVANMMFSLSIRELDRRYRETFGDPVASPGWKANGAVLAGLWGIVLTAAAMADMFLQANRRGPSIVALTLASYSLFVVVRDGSLRTHYLIVAAAGLASALVTAAVAPSMRVEWYGIDPARGHVFLLAYNLMGLGLVAAGLFDHHLLASSLRPAPAGDDRAAERHGASLTRAAIAAVFCVAAGGSLWKLSPLAIGLAFPMVLIIAGALSQILIAIRDINRWAREVKTRDAVRERPMRLDPQTLVLMFAVALAAAFDGAVLSSRTPSALPLAIGAWSAWVAVRDWPDRRHYLIGAFAALMVFFMIPYDLPARGFAVLVFATTGALAVEALIDYWKARHADTI